MRAVTFMYHDIVSGDDVGSSGFAGASADAYKLGVTAFQTHLAAIAAESGEPPGVVTAPSAPSATYITFDDGGRGAYLFAAPALEERGWRGHFFVATNFIGQPNFLSAGEIAELHQRGHVIGTHSASHPLRMAMCSRTELRDEWTRSVQRLSDILGEQVTTGSVPGGMYSTAVAEEANDAGIKYLFNSEPVTLVQHLNSCTVLGRFTVKRHTTPAYIRSLASRKLIPRAAEYLNWNFKKAAKSLGGEAYWRYRQGR